jgi:hypothetical protein
MPKAELGAYTANMILRRACPSPGFTPILLENTPSREFVMAEVVGLVSAGVGIAAFALQLASTIDTLHQICTINPSDVTKDLQSLSKKLEILHQFVLSLEPWEGCPPVHSMIDYVQSQYKDIEPALEELLAKFGDENGGQRRRWKRVKLVLSSHTKQIERIRQDINDITASLTL